MHQKEECLPLKNWKDFLQWEKSYDVNEWKSRLSPLAKRADFQLDAECKRVVSRKKSLFCHDMKGGYLEDRFINGVKDLSEEPYHFAHWSLIDIFVYFSHSFISVPPLGWINAAHTNGVSVLGTIILEGHEVDLLTTVLDCFELFAETAACLQRELGFEGWLLNFEMDGLTQTQVVRLLDFTKRLTSLCPTVIWYDSVTVEGALDWRNQLDEHNYAFFQAASGIYLNYGWSSKHLEDTNAFLEAKEEGSRKVDVFVGLDVFGRGCPGGGGFDSDVAMQMMAPFDFSVALFAPAWTYECSSPEETFFDREYRFWDKLRPYLNVRGVQLNDKQISEGFQVDFHPGSGREVNNDDSNDNCVSWWLNLRQQNIQPNYLCHSLSHVINGGLEICTTPGSPVPFFFAGIPSSIKDLIIEMHYEACSSRGKVQSSYLDLSLQHAENVSHSKGILKARLPIINTDFILLKLITSSEEINLIKIKYFILSFLQ